MQLPKQFTSFIGREQELSEIGERLANPACRLLTLVGQGGTGKTRLALKATAVSAPHFGDNIAFVNLQPIYKPDVMLTAIADALHISLAGQDDALAQICDYLQNKQVLLTLDNFEQLLETADLISHLLRHSQATLLITSREPLNIQEEWLFPIQGLPVADDAPAVKLFADRASRIQPRFDLAAEQDHVLTICHLVEGMPLAIELAAAWTRSLPCQEIAAELSQSIELLSTHLRNVPERHRSLEAIFEQTWERLTPKEQAVFQQLSVFRGGFRRDAATAVAGASLSILSSLIDKSLLRWENETGNVDYHGRYQIHELLRQYAAEKLAENQAKASQTQQQHTAYFANLLHDGLPTSVNEQYMANIQAELENIRFAWQQLLDQRRLADIQSLLAPLVWFYWHRSRFLEGRDTFAGALAFVKTLPETEERTRTLAAIQHNLAIFLMVLGDLDESTRLATTSLHLYETNQLPLPIGFDTDPRLTLANNARLLGELKTAVSHALAALAYNQQHANHRNIQEAYRMLAEAQLAQGLLDEAWHNAQQSFDLAQQVNDLSSLAYGHETLGGIAHAQGKGSQARHHYQASYDAWKQLGYDLGCADMLQRLGDLAIEAQDYEAAQTAYAGSLPIFEEKYVSGGILGGLARLGQTAVYQKQPNVARQHFLRALPLAQKYSAQFGDATQRLLSGIAHLLIDSNNLEEAVAILAYLQTQTSGDEQRLPSLRARCEAKLAKDVVKTAVLRGTTMSLATHLTHLETVLSTPFTTTVADVPAINQPLVDPLTPRELEVLQLIADGNTNKQIAAQLFLSLGTVKYYTSHIYGKLGVSHRTQAIAKARELGMIS